MSSTTLQTDTPAARARRSRLPRIVGRHLFLSVVVACMLVGVVLGSFAASQKNGEFASISLGGNVRQFVYGTIAMGAALFVGGCPTRLIIRTGYGDLGGFVALAGVAVGVVAATLMMRRVARR
jgi:hypothetical protein